MSDYDGNAEAELILSVTICTRNRALSLERTLNSLVAAAKHVTAPWELQIVDNGSTDHTRAMVTSFDGKLPIKLVVESTPGLSNARNAGIATAKGRYIIWSDDDVVFDEQWLGAYIKAFAKYPQAAIFGGAATPIYEDPTKGWFVAGECYLDSLLAIRDNPEWQEITPTRLPYGLNYALRSQEQRAFPYDPALGVAPGRRRGGEEVAVIQAALAAGASGVWVWDARVYHIIPTNRQTREYIWQYYRAQGYDYPVLPLSDAGVLVGRIPLKLLYFATRRWLGRIVKETMGRVSWIESYVDLARTIGTIDRLRESNK
jgi:glycosyltransferase involved in cell wall biosynthesis